MGIKDKENKAIHKISSVQKTNTEFSRANCTHNIVIFKDQLFYIGFYLVFGNTSRMSFNTEYIITIKFDVVFNKYFL